MKIIIGSFLILAMCGCGRNETGVSTTPPANRTAQSMSAPPPPPTSGGNPPQNSAAVPPASPSHVTKLLIRYEVGNFSGKPDESQSIEDILRGLNAMGQYGIDHPDPIIGFSKVVSDYDDFCAAEAAAKRRYFVYEPETKMYYVCVANRQGKWVSVPAYPPQPIFQPHGSEPPTRHDVVGRTHFVPDLKPGEKREIYLER